MGTGISIGVVGATGAVGRELLSILEKREFPVKELTLFASPRSEGKALNWKGKSHRCRTLREGCFEGLQIVFFDVADALAQKWVPHAAEAGAWVVDNSSVFRMADDVLLLVPEVNGESLEKRIRPGQVLSPRERILAGPNCAAAPLTMALKPLRDRWGLKRIVVSTYQSTSGAGAAAMEELSIQTVGMLNQSSVAPKVFPHPIAFNCIPHIGKFRPNGSTSEEEKIIEETRKILDLPQLAIAATAVRVPTFSCHAESVNVELNSQFELGELKKALSEQAGVILQDQPDQNIYPMGFLGNGATQAGVEAATGRDAVYVGRVRRDDSVPFGVQFWMVSDNLRKGAALNAVQVGEAILKYLG